MGKVGAAHIDIDKNHQRIKIIQEVFSKITQILFDDFLQKMKLGLVIIHLRPRNNLSNETIAFLHYQRRKCLESKRFLDARGILTAFFRS